MNITFWESASSANLTVLQGIASAFNSSQSKVHVTLVTQSGYDDTWQKYTAGLSNGQLPDVVQLEDDRTQEAIDTGSFLPVQSCMNAAKYSTSDFLARPLAYWKVNGVQWAMPFSVSAPIVYYNQNAFTKAGLNPNNPPLTLPQMLSDAKTLKASGSGMGLVLDPWHLETWLASANQLFVNNSNGRSARATKARVQQQDGGLHLQPAAPAGALRRRDDQPVHRAGPVRQPPRDREREVRHDDRDVGRVGHGDAVCSAKGSTPTSSSASGPSRCTARRSRAGSSPGAGACTSRTRSPALDQAASWTFVSYLMNTQSVATWAAGTGYIPVRKSSTQTATVQHLWATEPGLQGRLQRDQQRRELVGHLGLGHRPLRRRAHRRAQRRDLHVHTGRAGDRRPFESARVERRPDHRRATTAGS